MEKDKESDIINEIEKLKKEKNAIILAHYYQSDEIQNIADFVGDSLELSVKAKNNSADIIVFAGVKFMAETAKIISPEKKVLLPDMNAGCSLADSCNTIEFKKFIGNYPEKIVITYINSNAEIKALSDIICTSSNAVKIVNSLSTDKKIIFAPDRNLGNYVMEITGRDMILWNGSCHVHKRFSLEKILELKNENREALVLAHPECELPVRMIADFIGSTAAIINYVKKSDYKTFIIATENGILHQLKKNNKEKKFIPAPPTDESCGCNECSYMKLITTEKILNCLIEENNEIILDKEIIKKAGIPIFKMMEISEKC